MENHELRLHNRLKIHYDALVKAKEEQLQHSLKVNEDLDKSERERWAAAITELKVYLSPSF